MPEYKSDVRKLRQGDMLSETQYYEVRRVTPTDIDVINERGYEFSIGHGIVQEGIYSASQFVEEKLVTRTELIEIFSKVGDTVFEVGYNKQPKASDINDAIEGSNKGKILPIAEMKKNIKKAFEGEERVLVGYLISIETGFGRSMVIDLQADKSKSTVDWDSRIRQVDHRTLKYLIHKNIKYTVKK